MRLQKRQLAGAIRIPRELAIVGASQDIGIENVGDPLVLRPVVKRKLSGLAATFAAFPSGFMAEGRAFHEQKERSWKGFGESAARTVRTTKPAATNKPVHYLLDTNICVHLIQRQPPEPLRRFEAFEVRPKHRE